MYIDLSNDTRICLNAKQADVLSCGDVGASNKPVYFVDGEPTECTTYAGGTRIKLNGTTKGGSTVTVWTPTSAGTAGQLLVSTAAAPAWSSTIYNETKETSAGQTTAGTITSLGIYGNTYGNDASYLKTSGKLSYGDPGPQIEFSASKSSSQRGAIIFTDHDTIGTGASFSFVSTESDTQLIAPTIKALTKFIGTLQGNATTATALETRRTISLTGDVTGSVVFDGSADASITATVADDSHNHVIGNVDGLQDALNNKMTASPTYIEFNTNGALKGYGGYIDFHYHNSEGKPTNAAGEVISATPDYTSRILEDAAGRLTINGVQFKGGMMTGSLKGNAETATALETARKINGTEFDGSADITTANWGTARTISISSTAGTTGTSVNGSKNVSLIIPKTMTGFSSITSTNFRGILRRTFERDTSNAIHGIVWYDADDTTIHHYIMGHNTANAIIINPKYNSAKNAQDSTDGLYITDSFIKYNNNHLLREDNYTDYTVKKDGTGATGTWGISVTGNAGTATGFASAKTIALTGNVTGSATGGNGSNGWSITTTVASVPNSALPRRLQNYSTSGYGDANEATEQGFHYMTTTATNRPNFVGNTNNKDYRILTTAYSDQWLQQIATDFRCNEIYYRRRENGTWKSWIEILTSDLVLNNTSVAASGWSDATTAKRQLINHNTLAYWNGAYSGTSSNLTYCKHGAFGTMATVNKNHASTATTYGVGDASNYGHVILYPAASCTTFTSDSGGAVTPAAAKKAVTLFTNDYAPTKTGGGASGTWGISITGNAATATKATQDGDGNVISSTYAKLASPNNLIHAGNEFTFASNAYSGEIYINYRTASNTQNGNITGYRFCTGAGGTLSTIYAATFNQGGYNALDTRNVSGTANKVAKFTGTNVVGNSNITDDGSTITLGTKVVVQGNGSSYNEGIRILPASNGWSNVFFSANATVSGEHDGGWLIGRRGAAGGTCGAIGDFTIEEQSSSGANLTIHKNSGGATLQGKLTVNGAGYFCGRVNNSGDDEGVIIAPASNGYAGLCLGGASTVRSVFYLLPESSAHRAVWRYNNGSATYDISHPEVAGELIVHTADTAVGSATQPVYIAATGVATACTAYSGLLTAFSSSTNTLSITVGGTTKTATAVNSVANSWTAGTSAGPKITTTINGKAGTAVAIPSASSSASGVVTTGAQTFAGAKTFNSTVKSGNYFDATAAKGGMWISGTHEASFVASVATTAASGQFYQGWFSGKTQSGAWSLGALSGSEDLYFVYGTDANYNASTNTTVQATKIQASTGRLFGAAWNDYAEYRVCQDDYKPGQVVCENGDDTLSIATRRLQPGANVVSDTFGFAIGETELAKCPIAVSGRVLVYTYEPREEFKPGEAVCAGPNGTVSRMTREEIREYPECIIGTVSAVPTYETWGQTDIPVDGRIWIKIK